MKRKTNKKITNVKKIIGKKLTKKGKNEKEIIEKEY